MGGNDKAHSDTQLYFPVIDDKIIGKPSYEIEVRNDGVEWAFIE